MADDDDSLVVAESCDVETDDGLVVGLYEVWSFDSCFDVSQRYEGVVCFRRELSGTRVWYTDDWGPCELKSLNAHRGVDRP